MDNAEIRTKIPKENQLFYVVKSHMKGLGKQVGVKCVVAAWGTECRSQTYVESGEGGNMPADLGPGGMSRDCLEWVP